MGSEISANQSDSGSALHHPSAHRPHYKISTAEKSRCLLRFSRNVEVSQAELPRLELQVSSDAIDNGARRNGPPNPNVAHIDSANTEERSAQEEEAPLSPHAAHVGSPHAENISAQVDETPLNPVDAHVESPDADGRSAQEEEAPLSPDVAHAGSANIEERSAQGDKTPLSSGAAHTDSSGVEERSARGGRVARPAHLSYGLCRCR